MGSSKKKSNFLKHLLVNFRLTTMIKLITTMIKLITTMIKLITVVNRIFSSNFLKKLLFLWLEPIISNIKSTMTSHTYKEFMAIL